MQNENIPNEEEKTTTEAAPETAAEAVAEEAKEPTIEEQLAAAQAEAAEMKDAYLRARAETENVRRRAQEDIAKAHKFAVENFAKSLLGVMDSLEMALKTETASVEAMKEGVDATLKQLAHAFETGKITAIAPAAGDKMDPNRHQAISAVPSDQEPNTIVDVLQKGYLLNDRVLRAAVVVVAQKKA